MVYPAILQLYRRYFGIFGRKNPGHQHFEPLFRPGYLSKDAFNLTLMSGGSKWPGRKTG